MRFLLACLLLAGAARAEVTLIAKAAIPGNAIDRSGLKAPLENGVRGNLLGGFGSAIAYTGKGSVFIAVPDRGPNSKPYDPKVDDTTSYVSRFHTIDLRLERAAPGSALPYSIRPTLLSTTLLYSRTPLAYGRSKPAPNKAGAYYFTGRSDAFDPGKTSVWPGHGRLDPEGARLSRDGRSLFIADEYGPFLYRFDRASGRRIASYSLPGYYGVEKPGPAGREETRANGSGRVANRSMEGLAITPDGKALVGIMQSPLIQDGGVGGLSTRIAVIDVDGGRTREFAYVLSSRDNMVSEIVAIDEGEFLVDERDAAEGVKAAFKRIFRIALAGATDIRGTRELAATGVQPVSKTPFLDLLDPRHGLRGRNFPPRIEGLAFGPDVVMEGRTRRTLVVASDNDFVEDQPTWIYVFAVDRDDLAPVKPQPLGR